MNQYINIVNTVIPSFPSFKILELQDSDVINALNSEFLPYSDFNFTSLWSYNTENDIQISQLNKNIVILLRDYITNKQAYTFLGKNDTLSTIRTLLASANDKGIDPILKYIPEENVLASSEASSIFRIEEDRDNFDYIYSSEQLSDLKGNALHPQRRRVHQFLRENSNIGFMPINLQDKNIKALIIDMFILWEKLKGYTRDQTIHELTALQRLLVHSKSFNNCAYGVYDKEKLIGFSISELLNNNYAIMHFTKCNQTYKGVYQYMFKMNAREFLYKDCKYINMEQDLGIPGLRTAKEQWNPISYLKKYTISYPQIN